MSRDFERSEEIPLRHMVILLFYLSISDSILASFKRSKIRQKIFLFLRNKYKFKKWIQLILRLPIFKYKLFSPFISFVQLLEITLSTATWLFNFIWDNQPITHCDFLTFTCFDYAFYSRITTEIRDFERSEEIPLQLMVRYFLLLAHAHFCCPLIIWK